MTEKSESRNLLLSHGFRSRADWIRTSDLLTPRRSSRNAKRCISADKSATSDKPSFHVLFMQVLCLSSRRVLFSALTLHTLYRKEIATHWVDGMLRPIGTRIRIDDVEMAWTRFAPLNLARIVRFFLYLRVAGW